MADLTTRVLIEIRDEVRKTNSRLDQTNSRLDQTNTRLDETITRLDRLEQRQTQTEIRLATEIVSLVGAVHELRDVFIQDREYASRVEDHERRLIKLESRAGG